MAGMLTNGALAGVVNNMPPAGWLSESNIAGQGTPPAFSYADIGGKTGVLKITDQGYRTAMYQIIETTIGDCYRVSAETYNEYPHDLNGIISGNLCPTDTFDVLTWLTPDLPPGFDVLPQATKTSGKGSWETISYDFCGSSAGQAAVLFATWPAGPAYAASIEVRKLEANEMPSIVETMDCTPKCEAYTGDLCATIIGDSPIYIPGGFTQAEMERSGTEVGNVILSMNAGASAEEYAQVVRSVCLVYAPFSLCAEAEIKGVVVPLQRKPCLDFCHDIRAFNEAGLGGTDMLRTMALQGIAPGYELFLCDEFWPNMWVNGTHTATVDEVDIRVPCFAFSALDAEGALSILNDALANLECTAPLVSNDAFTDDLTNGDLCHFPCPSTIYSSSEYASQHLAYVLPAFVALPITATLLFQTMFRKKTHGLPVPIQFCAVLSLLYIVVGPVLSSILYHDLPCGCATDLCTGENALCDVSRISVFCIQAIQYFVVASVIPLYLKINNGGSYDTTSLEKNSPFVCLGVPLVCTVIGFALDSTDPEDDNYHWNQISSAFSCQLRLPNMATEWALVHVHTIATGTVFSFMVWSCFAVLYKVDRAAKRGTSKSGSSSLIPKTGRKIFAFGTLTMILLIINTAVQLYLVPLFINFGDESEIWLTCVKADWQSSRGVGNGCEDVYPTSRPPVPIMALRYFSMSAVPLVIGMIFGGKFLPQSVVSTIQRVTGTSTNGSKYSKEVKPEQSSGEISSYASDGGNE